MCVLFHRYRQKANEDKISITERVNSLMKEYNIPLDNVPIEAIESFCKNAAYVKRITYRPMNDPLSDTISKNNTKK